MFFLFSKILEILIEPLVLVFILLLIAVFSRNEVRRKRFSVAALAVFFIFTNNFIADEAMRSLEYPATPDTELHGTYDFGIVLGGMMNYDTKLKREQFDRGADRLFQALKLYREGKIKKIFIVGGSGSILLPDKRESPIARNYLVAIGVPTSDILIEPKSRNTHENALFARRILDSVDPGGRYLLITSAYHMPRAYRCFLKAGIVADRYSTDRYSGPRKFIFDHLFIPDKLALDEWDIILHEWMGFIAYKISGYI